MRRVLTDKLIAALPAAPAGRRVFIADLTVPRYVVRITDNGHKTLGMRSRFGGSKHSTFRAFGEFGAIDAATGRATAREWLLLLKQNVDPAEVVRQQRAAATDTSFGHVAEAYIARHLKGTRRAVRSAREIRKELIAKWGTRPIASIKRQDVVELVEAIADRSAVGRHAHNVFGLIRSIFNWSVARSIYNLEASPCDRLKPEAILGKKRSRERVLNDDEIRAVWRAAEQLSYPYGDVARLLLLSAARLREIAHASWSEVDLQKRTLTVPPERFKKNTTAHIIALSDDAMAVLAGVPRWARSDFIFTTSGQRPANDFHRAKQRLDALSGVDGWVLHDLRRTARTRLAEIGVTETVAELILGHARRGIVAVYDRHRYGGEIQSAMEAWAARLRTILAGSRPSSDGLTNKNNKRIKALSVV